MPMKLSLRPNPLLVYLSKRKTEIGLPDLGPIFGLWFLSIVLILISLHGDGPTFVCLDPFLCMAIPTYFSIALMPPYATLSSLTSSKNPSQIGLDDRVIALHRGGHAFGDFLAVVEHGDAIAQPHHQLHVVLDQQDGGAVGADAR